MPIGLIERIKTFINGDMLHADTHLNPLQDAIVGLTRAYSGDHDIEVELGTANESTHKQVTFKNCEVILTPLTGADNELLVLPKNYLAIDSPEPVLVGKRKVFGVFNQIFRVGQTIKALDGFAHIEDKTFTERLPLGSGTPVLGDWRVDGLGKMSCGPEHGPPTKVAFPLPVSPGHEVTKIEVELKYTIKALKTDELTFEAYNTSDAVAQFVGKDEVTVDNSEGVDPLTDTRTLTINLANDAVVGGPDKEYTLFISAPADHGFTVLSILRLSRTWTVPADTVITPK